MQRDQYLQNKSISTNSATRDIEFPTPRTAILDFPDESGNISSTFGTKEFGISRINLAMERMKEHNNNSGLILHLYFDDSNETDLQFSSLSTGTHQTQPTS